MTEKNISEEALHIIAVGQTDEARGKFNGLTMYDLIGAPLFAAAEAQEKLASANKTQIQQSDLENPVTEDGTVKNI